jgi:endonuclease/exonuclease/phosphatase family metal-dependent hydrolase
MSHFRVMSFNIRYGERSDGRRAWPNRRPIVLRTIRDHDPDVLGLQEPTLAQWKDVAAAMPGWLPFGVPGAGSNDGTTDPQGGFVRAERFRILDEGMFWLSETPGVAGSVSWANDWGARACGWARLHDHRAHRDLVFACTHFDTNAGTWLPSAKVLHGELDRVAGATPVVLVGDFNCAAGSDAHAYLRQTAGYRDAWIDAGHRDDGVVTYNGFTPWTRLPDDPGELQTWLESTSLPADIFGHYPAHVRIHRNYRIDWILLRGGLSAVSATIDCRNDRGLLPSDHYPVVAKIEWR